MALKDKLIPPANLANMVRVDPLPRPTPPLPEDNQNGFIAPTPSVLSTDADLRNQRVTKGGTWIPTFPLPVQSKIAAGAAAASQVKTIIEEGGPDLRTNGLENPDQSILNLIAGDNIGLSADGLGGVTITGGGGDGLIHGDAIWETDPAFVYLRDDFFGIGGLNGAITFTSEVAWKGILAPSLGPNAANFPVVGTVPMIGTSLASQVNLIFLSGPNADNLGNYFPNNSFPVFETVGWKCVWVFLINPALAQIISSGTIPAFSFTQASLYLGLGNISNQTSGISSTMVPRPPYFCGLRFDTDPTAPAISDSTFKFECVSNYTNSTVRAGLNPQGNVVDTAMVPAKSHIYRLELLCTAPGQVKMTLFDGTAGTSFSATLTMPKASGSVTNVVSSSGIGLVSVSPTPGTPFAPGSQMTIAGIVGTGSVFNGTWTVQDGNTVKLAIFQPSTLTTTPVTGTVTGYPGLLPYAAFGNDSSASPVANSKAIFVDFFSFAWNPAVGGGTGTPNTLKPRYW